MNLLWSRAALCAACLYFAFLLGVAVVVRGYDTNGISRRRNPLPRSSRVARATSPRHWIVGRGGNLGASSWQSAYSVAWHKLGPIEDDAPDIIQRVGHALEPFIAELFSEATGVETIDMGDFTVYQHRELSFLQCTPDRLTPAGEIVELKTASFAAAKEWKEHIPLGYQIQLSHQMAVMG